MLVELPGSLDLNPARAAVAQKYKKEYEYRLIISDIVRAITDKTVEDLLNNENT
jgi:hypothetical protein